MNDHIALLLNPSPDIESAAKGHGRVCRIARTSDEAINIATERTSVVDLIVADLDRRDTYSMLAGVAGCCHQTAIMTVSSRNDDGHRALPMRHPPVVHLARPFVTDEFEAMFQDN